MSSSPITPQSVNWEALADESVRHLQALLRCNTVNPPGNEGPAIQYIREQLAQEHIEAHIIEPTPGRPNLYARLKGNGKKRALLLLSHVDVVPVEREKWSVDPFGGEIQNGYIYGRGAVDMKCLTAKELTLFLHFARQVRETGNLFDRDLILLVVADEERNGTHGMAWIAQHQPELLDAEYAINEGGGFAFTIGGKRIYVCETAQKGCSQITLTAHGEPGHGSVPHSNNSIARLARAISRVSDAPLPLHVTQTMRHFITTLASVLPQPQRTLMPQILNPLLSEGILLALRDNGIANPIRAMLHNTASPTILQAGQALNVIPSQAIAQLDGRLIPGQTGESFERELRKRIADKKVDVEVSCSDNGHECTANTPLFDSISAAIAKHDPGALVVPYLLPAVTDSRFLVPKGVIAYGFDPMQPEPGWPTPQEMAHSHDERISVANMGFGTRVLADIIHPLL